ncbi:MAG: hypothetical protein ACE5FD_03130 [Anaerolineae bacterium]
MADKEQPGRFSRNGNYPGFIQFPHPLMLNHLKTWWETAVTELKGKSPLDFDGVELELKAAVELVSKYGTWGIEGVTIGDAQDGNIPAEVATWLINTASVYMLPFFPFGIRRKLFTSS